MTIESLRERVERVPYWYHRIELPGGITTPGWAPGDREAYRLPADFSGQRVLDVGAWDGYWTFECLRRGAREVVAIDDFSDHLGTHVARTAWETFDLCREALGYGEAQCRRIEMPVYAVTPEALGAFDTVLLFGTLYHLRHPLLALDRLSSVCRGQLLVETAILDDYSAYQGGLGHGYAGGQPVAEFYPGSEYGANPTNWWVPTLHCLAGMLRSAGFAGVETWKLDPAPSALSRCRGFARAVKSGPAPSSTGLLRLHGDFHDPVEVAGPHLAWGAKMAHLSGAPRPPVKASGRRLRVGYVSADFRRHHPVSFFFDPILERHDRRRFEIYCYSNVAIPDAGTSHVQSHAEKWRDITALTDETAGRLIEADGIDILIDLAGHTAGHRLGIFARKPAPVQMTWIGYPNTTGLAAIDYRITDALADPPGLTGHLHSEQLLRLDAGFLAYRPPTAAPPVAALPAWFNGGRITFGSFNHASKLNARVIAEWARILHRVPGSHLVLHHCLSDFHLPDSIERARIVDGFTSHGVEASRIVFAAPTPGFRANLELYGLIDIALDPFPYNGTTTTCEALWMGVPVVHVPGDCHVARTGLSLLTRARLPGLIATGPDDYVGRAVTLAADLAALAEQRAALRRHLLASPLFDAEAVTRSLEEQWSRLL